MNLFSHILLMIVSPGNGWEKLNHLSIPPKVLQSQVYFPSLAVLAATTMLQMFYDSTLTLPIALINSIIEFAAFFITFYVSSMVMKFYSPGSTQEANDRLDNLLMFALEYVVIINILGNMLPSSFTILEFLKLYAIFIILRGLKYINYEDKPHTFVTLASATVLLTPMAIRYILHLVIPTPLD